MVLKGKSEEASISFKQGETTARWNDLTGLPKAWKAGLPEGKYTLHAKTDLGPQTVTFIVEADSTRTAVLKRVNNVSSVLGTEDPLVPLLTAHVMLYQIPTDRNPPYLADALDVLDSLPKERRGAYLTRLRESVHGRLLEPGRLIPVLPADLPTGDKAIDEVRGFLAAGQWGRASNRLDALEDATGRTQALALLYRGVALSESGFKGEDEADDCFLAAITRLKTDGKLDDRYRAYVNYAGFQANRALDRLHNQPFQAAAGVAHPLTTALAAWSLAAENYSLALDLASELDPSDRAAVHVNLARLHAILADTLHGLQKADNQKTVQAAVEASRRTAAKHARAVIETKNAEPVVQALAESILAQLSLRMGNLNDCRKGAERARRLYIDAGSLPGVENAHRLLGLAYLAEKSAEGRKNALRHLQVAWEIGEVLREQYPAGKAGTSRAGFFARRAPVADLLIELLIEENRPVEALALVEQARARSLQDFLHSAALAETSGRPTRSVTELLADWPKDTVALTYHLGPEKGWVFLVEPPGRVRAFPLAGPKGEPIQPTQIVQRVRKFIREIDHLLDRERNRVLARKYDHSWQEHLHELYQILIPAEAAGALKKSKLAVIVPQHMLHYLPFAALVTQPDRGRDSSEVPRPRFLVEEQVNIIQVPSLTVWDRLRQVPASQIQDVRAIGHADASGLPGVAQDLANLKAAFGSRVKAIHTGNAAHEANAKTILATPGLAFFGSHGHERPDRPLDGQLIFEAPSPGNEDGLLTAAEVYAKPVRADLVVMSACYSGRADRSPLPGDDLFGLQRAFLQSGSKTVICGLWDVYDGKAPELMNGVFQRLVTGESAAAALAGSQREFIKKYRDLPEPRRYFTHPYFWAVYSVWGDDRTTVKP